MGWVSVIPEIQKLNWHFFRLPSDRKFSHLSLAAESSPEIGTSRRSKRLTVTLLVLMGELNSHFQPTRDFLHSSTTRANFSAGFSRLREIFVVFSLPLMMKILPSRSRIHLCKSLVALWWASMFFSFHPKDSLALPCRSCALSLSLLALFSWHTDEQSVLCCSLHDDNLLLFFWHISIFFVLLCAPNNRATCYLCNCAHFCCVASFRWCDCKYS